MTLRQEQPLDGFALAYDRIGSGPPAVLLHGWPGDRSDYSELAPRLADRLELLIPDLRGFGDSDKLVADPATHYSAAGQGTAVLGLLDELAIEEPVVLVGYDIGSRIAQLIARTRPERVRHLVIAPPLPGIGQRILDPDAQREFWYQPFHQLELATDLVDGHPDRVADYLRHFWRHWSGPGFEPTDERIAHLTQQYAPAGAFTASIAWYRAGAGAVASSLAEQVPDSADRITVPTTVLWPEHDPLFPPAWSDRVAEFFAEASLVPVTGVGHFGPVEAPEQWAEAVLATLTR